MTTEVLDFISQSMTDMGIEYAYMQISNDSVVYPYFIGDYTESPQMNEDGMQECTFTLNGFSRTSWAELEEAKSKIENYFDRTTGITTVTESGNGIAAYYSNSLNIPTNDMELKRIQINLTIKEWKVN